MTCPMTPHQNDPAVFLLVLAILLERSELERRIAALEARAARQARRSDGDGNTLCNLHGALADLTNKVENLSAVSVERADEIDDHIERLDDRLNGAGAYAHAAVRGRGTN